jgi:hypothetical protein
LIRGCVPGQDSVEITAPAIADGAAPLRQGLFNFICQYEVNGVTAFSKPVHSQAGSPLDLALPLDIDQYSAIGMVTADGRGNISGIKLLLRDDAAKTKLLSQDVQVTAREGTAQVPVNGKTLTFNCKRDK